MKIPVAKFFSAKYKNLCALLKKQRKYPFPGMVPVISYKNRKAQLSIYHSAPKNDAKSTPIRIKQVENPFIAILTSDGNISFNGNPRNFADIIRMGRMMGTTVYVLTPRGLGPGKTTVEGYLLDHRATHLRWIKTKLPLPHVVYNRIPTRLSEKSGDVQKAFHHLKTLRIPLFNPYFFDKWTLYTQLSAVSELSSRLPDTTHFDQSTLQGMCKKHAILYLKPINGKAGIGMIRISRSNKGYELIHQKSNHQKKKYMLASFSTLWTLIQNLCKKNAYLVQQGIPLAQYGGRPFDVRMLIQKNGKGEWGITGIGTRIAGKASITTHVPMGGKIENVSKVLKAVFRGQADTKIEQIKETGISFARTIEMKQKASLGEMSIDLGIDSNGRIWFFEANAKPMKFDEPEIRSRSLQRLIQYALYLSGAPQANKDVNG